MITEQEKEKMQMAKVQDSIALCEDTLKKAEKYERLAENKDWQAYLEDLKMLTVLHEREIKMGESMILDAPRTGYLRHEGEREVYVSSKEDWHDFIERHEMQREEADKWTKEPERILKMAAYVREKLPLLKKQLEEFQVGSRGNGAS